MTNHTSQTNPWHSGDEAQNTDGHITFINKNTIKVNAQSKIVFYFIGIFCFIFWKCQPVKTPLCVSLFTIWIFFLSFESLLIDKFTFHIYIYIVTLSCHTWHFFSCEQERNLKRKIIVKDRSIRWDCKSKNALVKERSIEKVVPSHFSPIRVRPIRLPWGYLSARPDDTAHHSSSGLSFMAVGWIPIRRLG